jgi:integrase
MIVQRRLQATNDAFLFPGAKPGKSISENTMIYACYRMGYLHRQTVHGFRGLGSTWANEAERYKPDWIEMALAHEDEDEVRGAYNSALYLTPRRRMLQDWADVIDAATAVSNVEKNPIEFSQFMRCSAPIQHLPPSDQRQPYWQRPLRAASR